MKVLPVGIVSELFIVVVPVVAPIETVVAAPPIFKAVAVVLNTFAVALSVVMSAVVAPLTLIPEDAVTAPVRVEVLSTVKVPLVWILPALEMVVPVEL